MSSATTRPSLRIVIRPHRRSASARSWVVRTIVASWVSRSSSMKDWTSSFERGSRPVVGSSSSSRVGLVSRARAMATFCCIPRLICSIGRSMPLLRDAQPGQDRDRLALGGLAIEAVQPGGEEEVLHRAELLEEGGVHADPVDQALDRHLLADDVVAEDLDPTLVEGQQSADEPDERRLAGAVGAEDPRGCRRARGASTRGRSPSPAASSDSTTNRLVTSSMRRAGTAVGRGQRQLGADRQHRLADRSVLQSNT